MWGLVVSVSRFIFGPFELDPLRLELRRDGVKLQVGFRACRVLLALVERAGRVVSQAELLAAAWPGLHVEDVNLRVHIVALRKALSGADEAVDITTVPREGYVFTGPVSVVGVTEAPTPSPSRPPRRLSPLIGRGEALERLGQALDAHRIVTVVGAGGIGKTALVLAAVVGREDGADAECVFVDFSTSVSSSHVAGRIFEALELDGAPSDIAAHIVRALKSRSVLLVFDNCEHVIGDVAAMAAALTSGTDGVSILATSREPLRVPGERVFPLEPLDCSPEGAVLTARSAMGYGAIQLFVEAAGLRSRTFAVDDGNASLLGEVCRRLDGIPLAIELAAATSDTMTIRELARRLDDRFAVLTRGARTALPKHRTLQAALDWSYDGLSPEEAAVMRRLGVFPGRFGAADAQVVAAVGGLSGAAVQDVLADLAAKSLVTVDVSAETATFRFLETMRVYARLKLLDSDEAFAVYARFVDHTLSRLDEIKSRAHTDDLKPLHAGVLDDWRAAHDWAARTGDWRMALKLLAAGIGFCQSLNIKAEYVVRASETLRGLPGDAQDEAVLRLELSVRDQQALMLVDTQPPSLSEGIEATALRALELSERLNAPDHEMSLLLSLISGAQASANRENLLAYTARIDALAKRTGNPDFLRTAHFQNGYAAYNRAQFGPAMRELDQALVGAKLGKPGEQLAFDHVPTVRLYRSRTLWMKGEFQSSLDEVEEAHRASIEGGHDPTTAFVAWSAGLCVYLWAGAFDRAASSAELYEELTRAHSNPGWAGYIPTMRQALDLLADGRRSFGAGPIHWTPYAPFHADHMASIYCAFHRPADLQRSEAMPDHWCTAEHLRAAGEHHLIAGRAEDAEACFSRALATAKAQGAAAWEIRAILSLARLRLMQEQAATARALLEPLVDRFPDRRFNADLDFAADLLSRC